MGMLRFKQQVCLIIKSITCRMLFEKKLRAYLYSEGVITVFCCRNYGNKMIVCNKTHHSNDY